MNKSNTNAKEKARRLGRAIGFAFMVISFIVVVMALIAFQEMGEVVGANWQKVRAVVISTTKGEETEEIRPHTNYSPESKFYAASEFEFLIDGKKCKVKKKSKSDYLPDNKFVTEWTKSYQLGKNVDLYLNPNLKSQASQRAENKELVFKSKDVIFDPRQSQRSQSTSTTWMVLGSLFSAIIGVVLLRKNAEPKDSRSYRKKKT